MQSHEVGGHILAQLTERPNTSIAELAILLDIPRTQARREVSRLRRAGQVAELSVDGWGACQGILCGLGFDAQPGLF